MHCLEIRYDFRLTGITVDAVGLPVVLGNLVMDERDDVWTNGSLEDGRQAHRGLGGSPLLVIDGDKGTGSRQCLRKKHIC